MSAERTDWAPAAARELYNVDGWGLGYFGVNEHGHMSVHPTQDPARGLDLYEIVTDLDGQGLGLPLLLRFPDILKARIETLVGRFGRAREEYDYSGGYTLVYPIKVNQERRVLEDIVEAGREFGVGLEVGSKPELQIVLALTEETNHLIVCNGYKDEEYLYLALMGQKLGHPVLIVLERLAEVDSLLKISSQMGIVPTAGVRIRLSSTGAGRWSASGGEASKFGLSAPELMRVMEKLEEAGASHILKMVHFHLGSQIPDILNIKQAMTEVARFYVELRKLGLGIEYVDVGGGLGVDYDGTRSSSAVSVNYSVQEYANDVVYTLSEACREAGVPMPHILSESGRALTAHHSLLLVDVIDVERGALGTVEEITAEMHPVVRDLGETLVGIDERPILEVLHDAVFWKDRLRSLFNTGVLSLPERALGDRLFLATMSRVAEVLRQEADLYEDILPEVEAALIDRYFCNFSVFQSLPDFWAVDQLFPIVPIHRLAERPTRRGTLHDVTCDSDGKIDRFVGAGEGLPGLELHEVGPGEPYILGVFLTGAYQEILGDLHNLFGDTNTVHLRLAVESDDPAYDIVGFAHGDTVADVLAFVHFESTALIATFRKKISRASGISRAEANAFIADYMAGLAGYTYLEGDLS